MAKRTELAELQASVTPTGEASFASSCKIMLKRKTQEIRLRIEDDPNPLRFLKNSGLQYLVTLPGVDVNCFFSRLNSAEGYLELAPKRTPIVIDSGRRLTRVRSGVMNFGKNDFLDLPGRKLILSHSGFIAELTPCRKTTIQYPPEIRSKRYRITHHLEITKEGGFTGSEATDFSFLLSDFLSFCHGHQVAIVLASGTDDGGESSYQTYGTGRLSAYTSGDSWMDRHTLRAIPSLFGPFAILREKASWQDTVRTLLYWLWRGHVARTGCDSAIILLQAALERLAWQVLVLEDAILSRTTFKRNSAAANTVALLNHLRIGVNIPSHMPELCEYAQKNACLSGPEALAQMRNDLVHPEKRTRPTSTPYYQGYLLSRWLVELVLLRLCNYEGKINNYTRPNRWVGQVEDPPWLSQA